jgi:eukaryotic-like serine/threonine-protein kinase
VEKTNTTDSFTQPGTSNQGRAGGDVGEPLPSLIGRFVVQKRLGQGGYATVYLAYDPDLDRLVALKLPRFDRFSVAAEVEHYVAEAKAAARLNHPGLVTVYDVNYDPGQLYIVLEYVEGQTLQQLLQMGRPELLRAVELMIEMAEAVAYAHERGLVHRDLKPGNILLDSKNHPHIADFGLAVCETGQRLKQGEIAGTPAYMAPEQVRGETHRLDGRTDIWSLGVILYRMLAGHHPFQGPDKPDLFEEILKRDPKPPRQHDRRVPRELERICLKCLSKPMTGRYSTAVDLADELRSWRQQAAADSGRFADSRGQVARADGTSGSESGISSSGRRPVIVVPKGLRAFDETDGDFYLTLLPGPVDRTGLPDSIRFWRTHLEQTDRDKTFSVGLLYGPSGCGKSSLVRAGLIPQLADTVQPVYLEATPHQTEKRLLRALQRACPALSDERSLDDAVMMLRERRCFPAGTDKVVLIVDQFEQWLHAHRAEPGAELIRALRQCDGESVQAILSVRDDFWLGISRFFRALEIEIIEGRNSALVDLFDLRHATRVLAAFGRALDALPDEDAGLTRDQAAFLRRSVRELAQDDRVICVRLAVFAEMMKARPWTWAELKTMGGAEGIGVTFLETSFCAKTAPPEHRVHQQAAQAVLRAMLSEQSIKLKGQVRPYRELLEASGYSRSPEEFDRLVGILDEQLRLITPVDAEGLEENPASDSPPRDQEKHYQLTHDYLVPAVRQWLTRKQRETRRGQYEIRLAERTELWTVKRERKQLPAWWEWLGIRLHTRQRTWTAPQRRMMQAAGRWHATRTALVGLALILMLGTGFEIQGRFRARATVDRLLTAETGEVTGIVGQMAPYRRWAKPLLNAAATRQDQDRRTGLRIRLALLPGDESQAGLLLPYLLDGTPEEVLIVRDWMSPYCDPFLDPVWDLVEDESQPPARRLRAACALAGWNARDLRWTEHAERVAGWLVSEDPLRLVDWTDLLRPASARLLEPLERAYHTGSDAESRRAAALVLSEYLADDLRRLIALIKDAQADQLRYITGNLSGLGEGMIGALTQELADLNRAEASGAPRCQARANVAVALLKLKCGDPAWPLLGSSPNPTARSHLIRRMAMADLDSGMLLEQLNREHSVTVRRALLLGLGQYDHQRLAQRQRDAVQRIASTLHNHDPDPGIHSASEWLLRRLGAEEELQKNLRSLAGQPPNGLRFWYVNSQRHTMALVKGPVEFEMGSPESEPGRDWYEHLHRATIEHSFFVATKEVSVDQFLRFRDDFSYSKASSPAGTCPINQVTLFDAMAYCNWLSGQEGLPEEQWCYESVDEEIRPKANWLELAGYRLPTETEWEYACRAGTQTSWFFGEDPSFLPFYGWGMSHAAGATRPCGSLMPNDLGLFDVYGNVAEWCQDQFMDDPEPGAKPKPKSEVYVCRGGSAWSRESAARSASKVGIHAPGRLYYVGFRVVRSLTDEK